MSADPVKIKTFWQSYAESAGQTPEATGPPPVAWGFGDSPTMADELGRLVVLGIKTATCSLLWEYEAGDEPLPHAGDLSIILDGAGRPLCILQTTQVEIKPYDDVDAQFAFDEGEGDRSLAFWRDAHWRFFSRTCREIGRSVSPDMLLVCERFKVVYAPA